MSLISVVFMPNTEEMKERGRNTIVTRVNTLMAFELLSSETSTLWRSTSLVLSNNACVSLTPVEVAPMLTGLL